MKVGYLERDYGLGVERERSRERDIDIKDYGFREGERETYRLVVRF